MALPDVYGSVTVLFEEPFWIGLVTRVDDGAYTVAKIVFGAEPTDNQVYAYLLENWRTLRFSPPIDAAPIAVRRENPKRMQRAIHRTLETPYIGTKSQQALQLQHEAGKQARKARAKEQREAEAARQFAIRQAKKRKKRQGH